MFAHAVLVALAVALLAAGGGCGDSGGGSSGASSGSKVVRKRYQPGKQPPHALARTRDPRYSSAAVERAMRRMPDAGRPSRAVCRRETPVERRLVTDFGRTAAPLFRCDVEIDQTPYSMHVQVLANGCFVAHAIDARQALQGCGVRG
jgi:hypothetical protein